MSKVTSKLQVTIPKALADEYGIKAGTEVQWVPAGEVIRLVPPGTRDPSEDRATRLEIFDRATERQRRRQGRTRLRTSRTRGWTREDLYDGRGSAR
jgi:AbrB family looped-hinge helix DNA binding protein